MFVLHNFVSCLRREYCILTHLALSGLVIISIICFLAFFLRPKYHTNTLYCSLRTHFCWILSDVISCLPDFSKWFDIQAQIGTRLDMPHEWPQIWDHMLKRKLLSCTSALLLCLRSRTCLSPCLSILKDTSSVCVHNSSRSIRFFIFHASENWPFQ